MDYLKRCAAIHDISCYGKSSLTVVVPVLSAAGIEACPLPTALLSTHTGIEHATFLDLTGEMKRIIAHWKTLDIKFGCIYSGFLGSEAQIDIVHDFMDNYTSKTLKVVDPVMGDNGTRYKTYTGELCDKMTELVKVSDITTPNLTEASILLKEDYPGENPDKTTIKKWLLKIAELGPKTVIITGITENDLITNMAYEKTENRFYSASRPYISAHTDGSGDLFTSVLTAGILNGLGLQPALDIASEFVYKTIKLTLKESGLKDGILFEPLLSGLYNDIINLKG